MADVYPQKTYAGYVPGPASGAGQPARQPASSETGIPPFLSILAQEAARRGYDATLPPLITEGIAALGLGGSSAALGSGAGTAASALGAIAPASLGAAATAPASTGAAATSASGGFVPSMSGLVQYGPGALGAVGLYDTLANDREGIRGYGQGIASGAGIGWTLGGPIGAGIGAIGGGLAKAAQDLFDSGKTRTQKERDNARDLLEQRGFFDKGDQTNDNNFWRALTFRDGSKFEFGHDLGDKLPGDRNYFDVDFKDPNAERAVGFTGPLAAALFPDNEDLRIAWNGYFTNAALNGGADPETSRQRAIEMYQRAGLDTPEKAFQAINSLNVSDQQKQIYMKDFEQLVRPQGAQYSPRAQAAAPAATPKPQQPLPKPIAPVGNSASTPAAAQSEAPSTSQAIASRLGPQYNLFPAYQNKSEAINNARSSGHLPRIPSVVGLFG